MGLKVAVAMAALLLTSACQAPWQHTDCSTTMIDWVNFVQVGSTQYVFGTVSTNEVQDSDLGPVYAKVKFRVNHNICDPHYRPKDGDAAFLEPGTPIYEVRGRSPGEELAARFNGSLVIYRAMTPAS
ncbi:MAG TPA: hypothetical protein VNG70_12955 [Candidatus Limnocylindria bacterium]|jgi:hypothetical protein|nr:hypothetical protein [Candidatus Limnocylindria bacterium]